MAERSRIWLLIVLASCLALGGIAVARLEAARAGLEITNLSVPGDTPATLYRRPDAGPAPIVVVAHGFAGSRQLMASFSLTLARAGYLVVAFDFLGHGSNPAPMRGDVTRVEGTTRLLMAELGRVAEAALALPEADGRLAYLGHSMASDIVIRQAQTTPQAQATIAVSMFSEALTATEPPNLLVLVGALEGRLREEALKALRLADPDATEGETVGDPAAGTGRRVVFAPGVEHVGVLYSETSLREARAWLDASFGRMSTGPVPERGGWIALLLAAILMLGWPLARLLPAGGPGTARLPRGRFLIATLAPALLVPLLLAPLDLRLLPVLVADYLGLHFALYGAGTLLLLRHWGVLTTVQLDSRTIAIGLAVASFGIAVFGGALDRYVASFFPNAERLLVIAILAAGSVPYLLADALLTEGGRAGAGRVLLVRGTFLASLMLAVALDFERLMFLVVILPVIVLFYLVFGTLSGWVGRRTGLPAAGGIGIGLVLAWALGCTFPLFAP